MTTTKKAKTLAESFLITFNASAPYAAVSTPDISASITEMLRTLNGKTGIRLTDDDAEIVSDKVTVAIYEWDAVNGLTPRCSAPPKDTRAHIALRAVTKAAKDWLEDGEKLASVSVNPLTMLRIAARLPDALREVFAEDKSQAAPTVAKKMKDYAFIIFAKNLHRYAMTEGDSKVEPAKATITQGISNLRDILKPQGSMFVCIGDDVRLAGGLKQDFLSYDQPLPNQQRIEQIFDEVMEGVDAAFIVEDIKRQAVNAVRGLSEFLCEQLFALALTKEGIDLASLWEAKKQAIKQNRGLELVEGQETFDDLKGYDNAVNLIQGLIESDVEPFNGVLWLDEVEKAFAGSGAEGGDNTGVAQDFLGTLCTWLQDAAIPGITLVGPPGTGKSALCKAAGSKKQIPVFRLDINAMKESLLGSSGTNLRNAIKVIEAITDGRVLVIATSNNLRGVPEELQSRIAKMGTVFVDFPRKDARPEIWSVWRNKFKLTDVESFDDRGWTGREISACAEMAYRFKIPVNVASAMISPVCVRSKEKMEALRQYASERYINAEEPGLYKYVPLDQLDAVLAPAVEVKATVGNRRRKRVED